MKPVFYHCISRVVDRKLAFGTIEKERFRTFMRMQENFTGCRVVSYCLMCNHIHLLIEVPPPPKDGFSDDSLLDRLKGIYNEAYVAEVAKELSTARQQVRDGLVDESVVVARIHERFTYRMHDLSEFMKTLMQRFTQWFNRTHTRTGNLWEEAFKSVIVEGGVAAKTIAAYIDLNPVRAGIVNDPAEYRWSSYGEAIGGGARGNGKKARAGLVRALRAHKGCEADATHWVNDVSREYRRQLMAGTVEKFESRIGKTGSLEQIRKRKGMTAAEVERENERAGELSRGRMLRYRVRYFTDGAVIGSRSFVNEAFANARERFGSNRSSGARKMKGSGTAASGVLWSLRDLRKDVV
ncbi:MAG: transposase [Gloeobacteraceae cyanobacterium ES-bin-144]|nr:transposase [Verrucomicrobiales bacterium]